MVTDADGDAERLREILNTPNPSRLAQLIFDYYHRRGDVDRSMIDLHIGMLCGVIARLQRDLGQAREEASRR